MLAKASEGPGGPEGRDDASDASSPSSKQQRGWFRSAAFDDGEFRNKTRGQSSQASATPEEDASFHVDSARRTALEHLQARKHILALRAQNGSGSSTRDEGGTWLLRRLGISRRRTKTSQSIDRDGPRHHGGYYDDGKQTGSAHDIISQRADERGMILARGAALEEEQEEEEEEEEEEESALSAAFLVSYFVAGGAAGAASRTVVSPLERLKIIMQVQPKPAGPAGKGAYSGVVSGLHKMWQEEGFKGYMRGNGINCLRIAPYSAVQFSTYEILKTYMTDNEGELDVTRRLVAGALAGIASVVSTYPLDLVRSRISIASASMYADAKKAVAADAPSADGKGEAQASRPSKPTREEVRRLIEERQKKVPGIWRMTAKVYREEGGIRALYKGCVPTSLGVAPYVGINFAAVRVGHCKKAG